LEIVSFGKFNKYLNAAWISLDALFLKLPTRFFWKIKSGLGHVPTMIFCVPWALRKLLTEKIIEIV